MLMVRISETFLQKKGKKRSVIASTNICRGVGIDRAKKNAKMGDQLGMELDPVKMILGS